MDAEVDKQYYMYIFVLILIHFSNMYNIVNFILIGWVNTKKAKNKIQIKNHYLVLSLNEL